MAVKDKDLFNAPDLFRYVFFMDQLKAAIIKLVLYIPKFFLLIFCPFIYFPLFQWEVLKVNLLLKFLSLKPISPSRSLPFTLSTFSPETLKYWVGVQRGHSYLIGRRCLFSFGWPHF